ncbi:HAUS augmin-like complex subunit 8 [Rhineura floridana]|uniref:HAUS augmin-like complex subunit 8 n=1 Tax=Rhineura floridana TaxID=261503 RepID=UPI002AC7F9D6|nr:HAUS augmin-like complex subunit 8 [Rhineura floridana]
MAGKAPLGGKPGGTPELEAGARPKQRGGRIVPSRYLQYDRKGTGKATSNTSLSFAKLEKTAPPKRPLVQFQKCKTSAEAIGVLQSTLVESHGSSRPDLEVSAIEDKSHLKISISKPSVQVTSRKKQTPASSDPDDLIGMLNSQILLLTYASVKMEKNLALLADNSEKSLITLCEEAGRLQAEVHKKKLKLQHLKKKHQLSEALDRQLEALGPVSLLCTKFREEYQHFATALDSTRHELPVKEIYMEGNKSQYLDSLRKVLTVTQNVLHETLSEHSEENAKALSVVKELEKASLKVVAELPRTFTHVLDLSADVSKEASLHHQKVCEDSKGLENVRQLYFC